MIDDDRSQAYTNAITGIELIRLTLTRTGDPIQKLNERACNV